MPTYAIGDIHGNYKALMQCIERSPFDPKADCLITLGDYIDGGSHIEVLPIFDYLTSLPHWIGLLGNHDEFLYQMIREGSDIINPEWLRLGGNHTLAAMGVEVDHSGEYSRVLSDIPSAVGDFLQQLRLMYMDDDDRVFVHAGWSPATARIEDSETVVDEHYFDLFWSRSFWQEAERDRDFPHKAVFIGHTVVGYEVPVKRGNVWNLDTGAGFEGRLTIMNVETEQYWQSDKTEALYPDYSRR